MKKEVITAILCILFCIVFMTAASIAGCSDNSDKDNQVTILSNGKEIIIDVEYVKTPEKRSAGLMHREHLDPDSGMLFVYPDEQERTFWMKNTLISLDIIFLSGQGKIVEIKQDFEPCRTEVCERYTTQEKVMYVLEVNAGFVEDKNIKAGDEVII
ncbi:DUF192 domain-containing protein [Thermoproteota archaeon]